MTDIDEKLLSKSTTALEVAERAGVSISAVSRTFTPGASVSAKTKARVLEAAQALGYQPNLAARSLSTQRSGIIGLVVGDIRNPYYPEVVDDFIRQFHEWGFRTMLASVWGDIGIDEVSPSLVQSRIDGVVIASIRDAEKLGEICYRAGSAVVLFNRPSKTAEALSSVRCDNVEGGRTVANYLLDRGYSRPAFVAGVEHISTTQERETGFRGRLSERGRDIVAREIGDYTYQGGYAAGMQLAQNIQNIDSIFCANDIMALGVMDALRFGVGLKVPEDIAVIGCDDIEAASWPSYNLTTVRHDKRILVREAATILRDQIQSGKRERRITLVPVEIVERGTVRS